MKRDQTPPTRHPRDLRAADLIAEAANRAGAFVLRPAGHAVDGAPVFQCDDCLITCTIWGFIVTRDADRVKLVDGANRTGAETAWFALAAVRTL